MRLSGRETGRKRERERGKRGVKLQLVLSEILIEHKVVRFRVPSWRFLVFLSWLYDNLSRLSQRLCKEGRGVLRTVD